MFHVPMPTNKSETAAAGREMAAGGAKPTETEMVQDGAPVCVRIWGGLGNQMFQYAAGHALAKRLGVELLVDPLELDLAHAAFGLNVFGLAPRIWQPDTTSLKARVLGALGRSSGKKRQKLWAGPRYVQKDFCHGDGFSGLGPGTYLSGYFQSEQFFADCRDDIRALFSLDHVAATLDPARLALADLPTSVCLHVRRGDYAANAKTTATHGLLGTEHYSRAAGLMARLVPEATWLVFSDDISAADDLTRDLPRRILIEGQSREQDLHLMSRCAHHVIANSSFSWWGAWLSRNPDRHVIAPRKWFARDELRRVYVDELFPAGWILL